MAKNSKSKRDIILSEFLRSIEESYMSKYSANDIAGYMYTDLLNMGFLNKKETIYVCNIVYELFAFYDYLEKNGVFGSGEYVSKDGINYSLNSADSDIWWLIARNADIEVNEIVGYVEKGVKESNINASLNEIIYPLAINYATNLSDIFEQKKKEERDKKQATRTRKKEEKQSRLYKRKNK